MNFSEIKGNEGAVQSLRSMADTGKVPHALMFFENPGSGGFQIAMAFLQYLYCEHHRDGNPCGECPSCRQIAKLVHPDIHFVFPVNSGSVIKGEHPVSEMAVREFRELALNNPYFTEQDLYSAIGIDNKSGLISSYEASGILKTLSLSAVSGGYRSVVMFLPERMHPSAANKLLKMIEEPPANTVFILITQSPEDVMGTIYSRCQGLRILPFDKAVMAKVDIQEEISDIWERMIAAIVSRDLLSALDCSDKISAVNSRDLQKEFCTYAALRIRTAFLVSKGLSDIAYSQDGDSFLANGSPFSSAFCLKCMELLNRSAMLIGRNVSAKMVFTDLVNHLFVMYDGKSGR